MPRRKPTGILAVDPGAKSGFSIWEAGARKPTSWGQVSLTDKRNHTFKSAKRMREIVEEAARLGCGVLVIEGAYKIHLPKKKKQSPGQKKDKDDKPDELGWATYFGIGVSYGRWIQLALEHEMRVVKVNPRSWQSKTIGTGPRKQQIQKYKDRAKDVTGEDLPADAAAAVVIGQWAVERRAWDDAVEDQKELGV